ncbi:MAG: hypothetical protein VKP62_10950 [Candidatus Sericytochromatia bacterium]|nr:hypothetical protein [Candidatus Sericytochromatia bacterium]
MPASRTSLSVPLAALWLAACALPPESLRELETMGSARRRPEAPASRGNGDAPPTSATQDGRSDGTGALLEPRAAAPIGSAPVPTVPQAGLAPSDVAPSPQTDPGNHRGPLISDRGTGVQWPAEDALWRLNTGIVSDLGGSLISNNGAALNGWQEPGTNAFPNARGPGGSAPAFLSTVASASLSGQLFSTVYPPSRALLSWRAPDGEQLTWGELDPTPKPELSTAVETAGTFRWQGLQVVKPTWLAANFVDPAIVKAPDEQLFWVVRPGQNNLRFAEATGALGTYLLARLVGNQARPDVALQALTAPLLDPANAAITRVWATKPRVATLTRATLLGAIDVWLAEDQALREALDAIRRAVLDAERQALGFGQSATAFPLWPFGGLAIASDGTLALTTLSPPLVMRVTPAGQLATALGTGQRALVLPPDGSPADEVAVTPVGPVVLDAAGRVLAVVKASETNRLAILGRDAQGRCKTLVSWAPDALEGGDPQALALGPGARLTVWTSAPARQKSIGFPTLRWQLAQAGQPPPAVKLRAWSWEVSSTGALLGPTRGEESLTPQGAPPGSSSTWRVSSGRIERVGLDGAVMEPHGSLPAGIRMGSWPRWISGPDGSVYLADGGIVCRVKGDQVTLVAGQVSRR